MTPSDILRIVLLPHILESLLSKDFLPVINVIVYDVSPLRTTLECYSVSNINEKPPVTLPFWLPPPPTFDLVLLDSSLNLNSINLINLETKFINHQYPSSLVSNRTPSASHLSSDKQTKNKQFFPPQLIRFDFFGLVFSGLLNQSFPCLLTRIYLIHPSTTPSLILYILYTLYTSLELRRSPPFLNFMSVFTPTRRNPHPFDLV